MQTSVLGNYFKLKTTLGIISWKFFGLKLRYISQKFKGSLLRFRFEPLYDWLNLELNFEFGPRGSGLNFGSEPNFGNTRHESLISSLANLNMIITHMYLFVFFTWRCTLHLLVYISLYFQQWAYSCYKLFLLSELFLLSLLSGYFCYLFLIFYDPEFFLFLLSFVDNGYADTV